MLKCLAFNKKIWSGQFAVHSRQFAPHNISLSHCKTVSDTILQLAPVLPTAYSKLQTLSTLFPFLLKSLREMQWHASFLDTQCKAR